MENSERSGAPIRQPSPAENVERVREPPMEKVSARRPDPPAAAGGKRREVWHARSAIRRWRTVSARFRLCGRRFVHPKGALPR